MVSPPTRGVGRDVGRGGRRARLALWLAAATVVAGSSPALAHDFFPQAAAVDQPRINVAFARIATPDTPLFGESIDPGNIFGPPIQTIQVQAFFDTGASGIVLGPETAGALGINLYEFNGELVEFGDIAADGFVPFNVSEELVVRIGSMWGAFDGLLDGDRGDALADPANFTTLYPHAFSPRRVQIGPVGSGGSGIPGLGEINVVGTPAMVGKVVVMDPRPTNKFFALLDGSPDADFDVFMRTHVYDRGAPDTSGDEFNPGIPRADLNVSLSQVDFSRFTTITPAGAERPALTTNPFIGPSPLNPGAPGQPPPVTLSLGAASADGSWLLDTGAAASFVSQHKAAELGVTYDPVNGVGSANPRLLGVDLDRQFTLAIAGISGEAFNIAGFYADNLLVRTDEGNAGDDLDPNHLNFRGAPVLVLDIELVDPDTGQLVILDGIFGMNFLVASALFIPDFPLPQILDPRDSPFNWITYDHDGGKLGLVLVPEPGALGALAFAGLLLRRRR